jgi:hypothetical protein
MIKTPEQKFKEKITEYKKKCQQIMGISQSIRYVGVINEYGRTLTGVIRPGVKPLLKSDDVKNEFFIISTLMTLRKVTSKTLGKLDYVVLKHENVTILAYQKGQETIYISLEGKEQRFDKIIPAIKEII